MIKLKQHLLISFFLVSIFGFAQNKKLDTLILSNKSLIQVESYTKDGFVTYFTDDYNNPPYTGYVIYPHRGLYEEDENIIFDYSSQMCLYEEGKCTKVFYYQSYKEYSNFEENSFVPDEYDSLVYYHETKEDKKVKRGLLVERFMEDYHHKRVYKLKNGKFHGRALYYYSGRLYCKKMYKNGEEHGVQKCYHYNGKLKDRARYRNGEIVGFDKIFDEEGNLIFKAKYKKGELIEILLDERKCVGEDCY